MQIKAEPDQRAAADQRFDQHCSSSGYAEPAHLEAAM
jgi:hypothetical protein